MVSTGMQRINECAEVQDAVNIRVQTCSEGNPASITREELMM